MLLLLSITSIIHALCYLIFFLIASFLRVFFVGYFTVYLVICSGAVCVHWPSGCSVSTYKIKNLIELLLLLLFLLLKISETSSCFPLLGKTGLQLDT